MKKLIIQFFKFLLISGTGWLIDTTIYTILTVILKYNVIFSNILSSIPAITFVFFVSTRKIFLTHIGKFSLKQKYLIYILYQIILIVTVSIIGQMLYNISEPLLNNKGLLKIIIKLTITPITMITNFFVMKFLAEKL
ncbi:hypothetical protein JCM16776_1917 [Leptotrichia shahii]|jgi:hypothetical protein|uniref:GtrA/DPMS transmembrane domain-containing protein n=1 Tax=Leptotrichia shahii TaxID=157691 RepID=A0A510JTA4_9FUSO|nr:GtrA family protein [Leptotrichia shahii]BBM41671.1 hypothetical protein JCM16776_1917 [Leptotrichia shahii]